jgi:hypothetical protein
MWKHKKMKSGLSMKEIACTVIVAALVITLSIGLGATQNETKQNETQPENIASSVAELDESEDNTDGTAPIQTIQKQETATDNTTDDATGVTIQTPENATDNTTDNATSVTLQTPETATNTTTANATGVTLQAPETATDNTSVIGLNYTINESAGESRNNNVTESVIGTPKLIANKESYSLDEEPAFSFEYTTFNNSYIKNASQKTFKNVTENASREMLSSVSEEAATGTPQKALKKWVTENETIETCVYDSSGALTDIAPEIAKTGEGKFAIELPKERAFRAGVYTLSVELVKDEHVYVLESEFPWGLVSVNTQKSIYKPGETTEFVIVVLDKTGHSVSNADIYLTVNNPNNEETTYSTADGTITASSESGIYNVDYHTEVEGNHTVFVTALIDNVEVSFNTYFRVLQAYEFDLVRTAESKIDPTKQDWFVVTIDIESFTDAESVTVKEFVPAVFDVSSTGAATILLEDDMKTITWNKDLIANKTSVSYSYSVPHIWPYLYALGPAEIDYDSKSFIEARPWYVAVDPAEETLRPDGTGDKYTWASGTYSSVNDQSDDTYLETSGTSWQEGLFSTANHSAGSGTINWVRVYIRYEDSSFITNHAKVRTSMKTNGNEYDGAEVTCGGSWADTYTEYATNPSTGSDWTWDDINSIQIGADGKRSFFGTCNARVAEVWLVVNYTPPATVQTPSTYDNSTLEAKTIFARNDGLTVRVNVTNPDGRSYIDTVLITILNTTDAVKVDNATMTNITEITDGYTYEYNYTIPSDADGGTWTINVYANNTANAWDSNTTTFDVYGWSNVTWDSPPDGSNYTIGETITLTCLVRDANTSSPIQNYPVHFYNRTDSTETYLGMNYTNGSGYAVMDWDTSGVAPGWYYPKCNITDNATLYYNVTADNEANTSVELKYATTLEIRNQTASQGISFINFSGESGTTVSDPYNNVDGSGNPQNITSNSPVVTIYNPSSSTNYTIWLKVEEVSGWSTIINDEKFNVTADDTSPGAVSSWTTLTSGGSYKDTGVTVSVGTYKDLYLAYELKGSGTGTSTVSVLGEAV